MIRVVLVLLWLTTFVVLVGAIALLGGVGRVQASAGPDVHAEILRCWGLLRS